MRTRFHIVIVGGGFCGVALATQLAKRGESGLAVTLLEAGERFGRGSAYGTSLNVHVLNTAAGQMSLHSDDPDHFMRWQARRGDPVAATDFSARGIYGDYLEDTLLETLAGSSPSAATRFDARLRSRATDIRRRKGGFDVILADDRTLSCDAVVLATGNPEPADPLGKWLWRPSDRYLRNPWHFPDLDVIGASDRVLLLGTGLTMVDVVLALGHNGHQRRIHAVSRRGLLPRPHPAQAQTLPEDLLERLHAGLADTDLLGALHTVRRIVAQAAARGVDWHAVVDAVRPATPRIWAGFGLADRRRFLRWLRPYWDAHRHRMAPVPARAIADLCVAGRLEVRAGRIRSAVDPGDAIVVQHEFRDSPRNHRRTYDWVINCTGPAFGAQSGRILENRLLERGILSPDPLGLGYLSMTNGTVMGAHGPIAGLYLLGPACRSRGWEHTAVPELREQAEQLAIELLDRRSDRAALKRVAVIEQNCPQPVVGLSTWLSRHFPWKLRDHNTRTTAARLRQLTSGR